eukprot:scaffold23420_cov21-Tisochrysis_lutea.AAC.1
MFIFFVRALTVLCQGISSPHTVAPFCFSKAACVGSSPELASIHASRGSQPEHGIWPVRQMELRYKLPDSDRIRLQPAKKGHT